MALFLLSSFPHWTLDFLDAGRWISTRLPRIGWTGRLGRLGELRADMDLA